MYKIKVLNGKYIAAIYYNQNAEIGRQIAEIYHPKATRIEVEPVG